MVHVKKKRQGMGEIGKTKTMFIEYSLEGLLVKLKLQYFGHLLQLTGKDPDAGKD